jgi:DNA (cytosine-5)-methyltransferase 1
MPLKHLDLFAGIGGFTLAAQWAGMETVGFVEWDAFCQRVLAKNFPNVPLLAKDIHDFNATGLRGSVGLVTGGFPCQPFSVAGLRRGQADDRAIWPQMLRVITECRPSWVVGENVTGLIDMALDDVLASLEGEGYEAWTLVFPACAVGARHIRQRVFIVAHDSDAGGRNCNGRRQREGGGESAAEHQTTERRTHPLAPERFCEALPDADIAGWQERNTAAVAGGTALPDWRVDTRGSQWEREPAMGRMVNGLSAGLDIAKRLKALGNAVVPQQVYPILAAIAAHEQNAEVNA